MSSEETETSADGIKGFSPFISYWSTLIVQGCDWQEEQKCILSLIHTGCPKQIFDAW